MAVAAAALEGKTWPSARARIQGKQAGRWWNIEAARSSRVVESHLQAFYIFIETKLPCASAMSLMRPVVRRLRAL